FRGRPQSWRRGTGAVAARNRRAAVMVGAFKHRLQCADEPVRKLAHCAALQCAEEGGCSARLMIGISQSSVDRQTSRCEDAHHQPPRQRIGPDKRTRNRGRTGSMSDLTQVELFWLKKRIENWVRFGRVAQETILDRNRRVVSFVPGSIFAFVRWASNDYGMAVSRIDVLRAARPGERYSTVPYVRPGGESLLRLSGWPKVEKVLQAIDAVEALGIHPADAAPEYWQHVHNRLSVDDEPRRYTHTPQPQGVGRPFNTACPSMKSRAATRTRGTRLGCAGGGLRYELPLPDTPHHDLRCIRRDHHDRSEAGAQPSLECVRERSHWP